MTKPWCTVILMMGSIEGPRIHPAYGYVIWQQQYESRDRSRAAQRIAVEDVTSLLLMRRVDAYTLDFRHN